MGKFIEQQEHKKEAKERDKLSRENLGKFFYDLARTSFTAMVAGAVVPFFTDTLTNENWYYLLIIGGFSTFAFAFLGYTIINK